MKNVGWWSTGCSQRSRGAVCVKTELVSVEGGREGGGRGREGKGRLIGRKKDEEGEKDDD